MLGLALGILIYGLANVGEVASPGSSASAMV
jgi:hypothetical protein